MYSSNSKGRGGGGGGKSSKAQAKGGGGHKGGYHKGNKDNDQEAWDAAQLRSLHEGTRQQIDFRQPRPQRRVEAFPQLTVAADWQESRAPRSGSAFYLPLMWTALLPEQGVEATPSGAEAALRKFNSLGDASHFHNGSASRSSLENVWAAQVYWRSVFSGWDDWVRRMRLAMNRFAGGRDGLVTRHVQTLSVKACALIYGDLRVLGALPHICNARRSPDQDAILELDFDVRMEIEASVHTLFVSGGEIIAAPVAAADPRKRPAEGAAGVSAAAVFDGAVADDAQAKEVTSDAASELNKEVMKLRKKLREIEKLKKRPADELDSLQRKKLEGEAELLAALVELEARANVC